ncbi:transporter of the major facilitator superfamily (MFS) [Legionella gratiana]|uniref:Transporter of the major facilitator superfamily (MFS) n=1 Tax=Legionella gratiana TaxID=45066 RepID=A0A378JE55_9GAMM|nr:MFS transporter [Legionella gratiana]KTD09159.1 transporter of the major facilitator superfamily (MFS) [Legionella gratiana]STX45626.1 transporter of the major facilitator superfamily (MFS) [Legionella gratiana]
MLQLSNYSTKQLFAVVIIGTMMMMESIDTNILNVAIPAMAQSLGVSALSLKLPITSYLISLSVFIPISGYLADKFGTKIILMIAIFSFGLFSLLCGWATSLVQLTCFRILQGVAGALLVPVGRLLMLRVFSKQELVKVYMFISMPLLLGPLLAPYIGGLLVSHLSWRSIFYVNVPFALLMLFATWRFVDNYTQSTQPFNWPSFVSLALFLAITAYWLDTTSEITSSITQLLILMVIIMSFVIYLIIESKSEHQIIHFKLFQIRTYKLCFFSSALSRITLGARAFIIVLYLQLSLSMSPSESGLLISSMAIGYLFSRIFITRYLKRFGFKRTLLWSNFGTCLATVLLCFIEQANVFAWMVMIALGFFSAIVLLLLNVLCFSDIENEKYAAATSLNSTTQQLFVSLGVSIAAGSIHLFNYSFGTFTMTSFHAAFICIAVISLMGQIPFLKLQNSDGDNLL